MDEPAITERGDRETGMGEEEYERNRAAFDNWIIKNKGRHDHMIKKNEATVTATKTNQQRAAEVSAALVKLNADFSAKCIEAWKINSASQGGYGVVEPVDFGGDGSPGPAILSKYRSDWQRLNTEAIDLRNAGETVQDVRRLDAASVIKTALYDSKIHVKRN